MSKITFKVPPELGAVNTYVTDARGISIAPRQLSTPGDTARTISVSVPGTYTLYWSPVGGQVRSLQFAAGEEYLNIELPKIDRGFLIDEIDGSRLPQIRDEASIRSASARSKGSTATSRKNVARSAAGILEKGFLTSFQTSADESATPVQIPESDFSFEVEGEKNDNQTQSLPGGFLRKPRSSAHFSVGISSDSTPSKMGGWRPYFAPFPVKTMASSDRLTFRTDREADVPLSADGARVRYSLAVEDAYIRRFLVPIYSGGVEVTLRGFGISDRDLALSIMPVDPQARTIIQALTASSSNEARALTNDLELTADSFLARIWDQKIVDPWLAVALGLVMKRYDWDSDDISWIDTFIDQFGWVTDSFVLAAWWKSTPAGGSDLNACVRHLTEARRRGALYFADANAMMGDLLVWLATDGPEQLRDVAHRELLLWRNNIPYQSRAGAHFTWLTANGNRKKGRVSGRYDFVAFEGKVSDLAESPRASEMLTSLAGSPNEEKPRNA